MKIKTIMYQIRGTTQIRMCEKTLTLPPAGMLGNVPLRGTLSHPRNAPYREKDYHRCTMINADYANKHKEILTQRSQRRRNKFIKFLRFIRFKILTEMKISGAVFAPARTERGG